ncbi:hypothetical protein VM1G_05829 [Cytospora mali]|uniref:Anaphase-promoting complex, subunit CDC26 n=1 Tax=Cytospora mali TaxID=578113 RepID=A0A194W1P4_CYTMA|nr:hypothetical protein VM1G_05829 [Valsa mali]
MLRRPPTVLTLTTEDVKAYEDRSEAAAFKRETAAAAALHHHRRRQHQHQNQHQHQHQHQHQLTRDVSGMDITGMTTSSSEDDDLDDDNSEAEVSYYPSAFGRGYQNQGQDHIDGPTSPTQRGALHRGGGIPHGEEIYLNEEGSYDDTDSDEDGGFVEDEDMADEPAGHEQEAPGGVAEMDLDAAVAAAAAAAANTTFDGANSDDNQHPEPPPAPSRITRATRTTSREPPAPQHQEQQQQLLQQQQQQQQEPAQPLPPPHTARYTRTQATRRAPSGRARGTVAGAGVEATTPTPIAQAQRDAADRARAVRAAQAQAQAQGRGGSAMGTPDARVTRSRDERIGVPRGGRR